jgi:hypothetical protein
MYAVSSRQCVVGSNGQWANKVGSEEWTVKRGNGSGKWTPGQWTVTVAVSGGQVFWTLAYAGPSCIRSICSWNEKTKNNATTDTHTMPDLF